MAHMKLMKLDRILIKGHAVLTERWVQEQIALDPKILGLGGDLILKDKERNQPRAGRLDLLLQDIETGRRYEVEVQLGDTDESHIIRTIEYWDIERKRYPQYDHCAVIVAEQITARFLNVISLFNGTIPLIAIQMAAYSKGDEVALIFTTVLNELSRGLIDEDEDPQPNTDRQYWIAQASAETVEIADKLLQKIQEFAPQVQLTYKKQYIGLSIDGEPNNFVIFEPKRNHVRVGFRLDQSEPIREQLEASQLDVMSYDKGFRRYRVRLAAPDLAVPANQVLLGELMKQAYDASR
jgi:hypothetical protein